MGNDATALQTNVKDINIYPLLDSLL